MKCKGELKRKSQIAKEKKNVVVNPPSKDLPYPHAPTKEDKEKKYARFLEIFKQLEVNVPFLEAIEQMPTYAKFMKEIFTKKRFIEQDTIQLSAWCSAFFLKNLPLKP